MVYIENSNKQQNNLFSGTHGIFSKTGQMLGHKTSLINLKELKSHKVCSPTVIELNYISIKLETGKSSSVWKLNFTHFSTTYGSVKEEIKRKIREYF